MLGEVAQPGAYTVSPSATLFSALYYFKGPTILGSLRDIRLIRDGVEISSIDFYDYLFTGKKPNDQKLQFDDVIFLPKRKKTITINGEINRPGIYELRSGEYLRDLISMAGELKITAYLDRAQIDRVVPFDKRLELRMDRMFNDVNLINVLGGEDKIELQDGDLIRIFSVLNMRKNVVDIEGAIARPGTYELGDSLKLSELLNKADGVLGDAYLDRVDIVRIKPDFNESIIKLNLKNILDGQLNSDISLQSLDRVKVYSMTEMISNTYVSINGHVKQPGRYKLQENMTLYDLIFKAGGFVDEEFKKKAYLKRAELVRLDDDGEEKIIPFNLGLVLQNLDFAKTLMKADDAVRIYTKSEVRGDTRYVSITGHVKKPGRYELFENNMTLYDLIFMAGGFVDEEFKNKTYLERADLYRINKLDNKKQIISFNLSSILNREGFHSMALEPNDDIRIYSMEEILGKTRSVKITGNVKRPGKYELYENNMRVKDLLFMAGGFEDLEFKEDIYFPRADLIRFEKKSN